MQRSLTRPRACSTGQSSSENALLQPTRRLHQHLCNRPGLLPGLLGRVPATPYMHYVSAIPGSWQPRKHAAPGTSPFASTPSTVTSAAPHSRGQLQVEARHRGNKASPNEPVFSYQQLFSQDMTSSSAKQQQQQQRQQSQAQQQPSRGFGRSKSRKAGGASGGAGAEPADGAAGPAGTAVVHFCITRQVEYGQNMRMTGAGEQMGAWDSSKGPKLKWSEGHKWTADVPMPPGAYEFKFLIEHRSGHLEWEGGSNRSFTVPKTAAQMQVAGRWNSTEETEVLEMQQQSAYRQQMQKLQHREEQLEDLQREEEATARAEAAAFAAANKAAAAAYQQQADAEAAAAAAGSAAGPAIRAPADLFQIDLGLLDSDVPGHQQLMQVLQGFREDMIEGLTGVTCTMQEIQDDLSQVQQQMSRLSAERFLDQSGLVLPADASSEAAIIAADAAVSQEQALSGLQGVVQTWQQELVSFRQDSTGLRQDLEELRVSLESQMADNTAAVHELESLVKQLIGIEGVAGQRPSSVVAASAVVRTPPPLLAGGGAAAAAGGAGSRSSAGPNNEMLDPDDKMLLERINHLASDLSTEMKEAVQELELQQQSLLERHQHIIADMSISSSGNNKNRMALDLGYGAGLGMRMQPTNTGAGVSASSRGGQLAAAHVTRAVAHWLESRDVQQYHQGLVVAVMISSGLWQDSMWEQMEGGALRATYKAYKSVWSTACLQTWKDNITTKQALLTALSSGRQHLLSMHVLWSLEELTTHSPQLRQQLAVVATPIELGLMQKLRQKGGAGQGWALGVTGAPVGGGEAAAAAQCAVLLQRWLAAADDTW